jgi:GNAT superfamily N-acetyltransferase
MRPAGPADLEAVRRIVREGYTPYIGRIGRPPGPMLDDYAALIAEGAVTVAEVEDAPVGILVLLDRPYHLLLDNVVVDPAWRGRGVGRALLDLAESEARRRGHAEVRLYTHVLMTENIALYGRAGYVETGRGEQNGYDRVFFAKALG